MVPSRLRPALRTLPVLLALAAACGGDRKAPTKEGAAAPEVPEAQRFGGTAVIGAYGDLQSMNALTSSDNNSANVQREVLFMPLVQYDENINAVPWLAEKVDTARVAGDSLEITFHVRKDVKWHDGKPTTARDVLFTYQRAVDPQTAFPNASAFDLYSKTPKLIDDYTISFRLRPHSDFLDIWYQTAIMPEHVLGKVPPAELLKHPFGTQSPLGNGPFKFVRRLSGQEWVFEANPDFPQALGGRPYLDRLVWRYIPEQTTLLTELITGGVDVYLSPLPAQAQRIESDPSARIIEAPFRQWVYLAWNTRLPMFSDARTRRALTMAIDRNGIVDALLYGRAEVGRSSVTPSHWSWDPKDPQTQLPYDTTAAKRLLAEAGWQDRNRDGVLEDAQGRPFRFTIKTNQGNELRKDIAEIVQAQLQPLGIQAQVSQVEWNTLIEQLQGARNAQGVRERDFEATINGWVDFFRKDDRDILHSSNLNDPFQYVGYSHPRIDQLIDTLAVMVDREAARPLWREYQRLLVQESPYTVIYYPRRITGVHRRLQGVEMDTRSELITLRKWWMAPSDRRPGGPAAAPAAAPAPDTGKGAPADTAKK